MTLSGYSFKVRTTRERPLPHPPYHYENGEYSDFDLPAVIERLKKEKNWSHGELVSVILFKSSAVKVLLTILHKDTEVISYQADDSANLQVIEGSLIVHVRNDSIMLKQGEDLTLDEKIRYSYNTLEETAVLLTLVSEKKGKR